MACNQPLDGFGFRDFGYSTNMDVNPRTFADSNIAIPVASFYEKSGTYINNDGFKQKVISKMNKNNPMKTITTIIEDLKSMIEKGTL